MFFLGLVILIGIGLWLFHGWAQLEVAKDGVKQGWEDASKYPDEHSPPEHATKAYTAGWEQQRLQERRSAAATQRAKKEWREKRSTALDAMFQREQAHREERMTELRARIQAAKDEDDIWKEELDMLEAFSERAIPKNASDPIAWEMECYLMILRRDFLPEIEALCERASEEEEAQMHAQYVLKDEPDDEDRPDYVERLQQTRLEIQERAENFTRVMDYHSGVAPHVASLNQILRDATLRLRSAPTSRLRKPAQLDCSE